jgi:hypothetical protein
LIKIISLQLKKFHIIIIGVLLSLNYSITSVSAQDFVRVESISGFNEVGENNGVAVADYDRDLDLDIFIVAMVKDQNGIEISHSKLFRNNNDGSFTDVTLASGLVDLLPESEPGDEFSALKGFKYGVSWGDFDNDGFPDIFFTHAYKIQLFRNIGDGSFEDITEDAGLEEVNSCRNTGASWWDYDNDGNLDLYINDWNECSSNTLYRNNGDSTFTNVTVGTGMDLQGIRASFTALPFDFNDDNWMDLYNSNDLVDPNDLLISQNGVSFVEQAQQY